MPKDKIKIEDFAAKEGQLNGYSMAEMFFYGMTRGKSMEDVVNMSPEEKKKLGSEFAELTENAERTGFYFTDKSLLNLDENIVDASIDKRAALALKNGQMVWKAATMLLNEKLPEYNAENMKETPEESMNRIESIREVGLVIQAVMERYKDDNDYELKYAFTEGLGGRRNFWGLDEKLKLTDSYINYMEASADYGVNKGLFAPVRDELRNDSAGRTVQAGTDLYSVSAAAEKLAGDTYLKGIGKYEEGLTVDSLSAQAAKAGIKAATLQAAEEAAHKNAMKLAAEKNPGGDIYDYLKENSEFKENLSKDTKAEADKKTRELYEENNAYAEKYSEYISSFMRQAKKARTFGEQNMADLFPSQPDSQNEADLDALIDNELKHKESIEKIEGFFKIDSKGNETEAVGKAEGLITFAVLLTVKNNPELTVSEVIDGLSRGNDFKEAVGPTPLVFGREDFILDEEDRKNENPDLKSADISGSKDKDPEIANLEAMLEELESQTPSASAEEQGKGRTKPRGKDMVKPVNFNLKTREGAGYKKIAALVAKESFGILEAFDCVNENPEKLGGLIADAAKAFSEINPNRELKKHNELYGSGKTIEGVDKLKSAATMSALSRFCENADIVINSAVKGRNSDLPFTAETEKGGLTAAQKVYEAARAEMTPEEQRKFTNASENKYQRNMILGVYSTYEKHMADRAKLESGGFAAVNTARSVILKNDFPLHSFPKEAAAEVENAKNIANMPAGHAYAAPRNTMPRQALYPGTVQQNGRAAEAAENRRAPSEQKKEGAVSESTRSNETAEPEKNTPRAMPAVPGRLSLWVRFWNSLLGLYKDSIRDYNTAVAEYANYLDNEKAEKAAGKAPSKAEKAEPAVSAKKVGLESLKKASPSMGEASKTAEKRTPAVERKAPEIKTPSRSM